MNPVKNEIPNLQQLVNRLVATYQPVAMDQNSFLVNEVSPRLDIQADLEVLTTILGSLFYLVARCSRDTSVKIDAVTYGHEVVVELKDNNPRNSYTILYDLLRSKLISWKIGGLLGIDTNKNGSLVSFSFINKSAAEQNPALLKLRTA